MSSMVKWLAGALLATWMTAGAIGPAGPSPDTRVSLRFPETSHDVEVSYRQIEPDLSDYAVTSGDDLALRSKQLQATLAFGGRLTVDVPFKIRERGFAAGKRPMAFTVDGNGALRWFLVEGQDTVPIAFEPVEPGFDSPRLTMQLQFVTRSEVHLLWHLGTRAGLLTLRTGRG